MKGGEESGFGGPVIIAAPTRGTCPLCAIRHAKNAPHCRSSVYYQMRFRQMHGRVPTQDDAAMHCEQELETTPRTQKGNTKA